MTASDIARIDERITALINEYINTPLTTDVYCRRYRKLTEQRERIEKAMAAKDTKP